MEKDIDGLYGYTIDESGRVYSKKVGRYLKPHLNLGYYRLCLSQNGRRVNRTVHRLVAVAFIDNQHKYPEINHKNGIKTDNMLSNLEWCNRSMNIQHAYDTGLKIAPSGPKHRHPRRKLSDTQIIEIKQEYKKGQITQRELAEKYGVGRCAITHITTGRNWKHL